MVLEFKNIKEDSYFNVNKSGDVVEGVVTKITKYGAFLSCPTIIQDYAIFQKYLMNLLKM